MSSPAMNAPPAPCPLPDHETPVMLGSRTSVPPPFTPRPRVVRGLAVKASLPPASRIDAPVGYEKAGSGMLRLAAESVACTV